MAANLLDYFKKAGASTVTTLSAPGKALAANSITVGSTTNYPTDTGIVIAIRQVDANGNLIAGTYTEWNAIVTSATTLTIGTVPVLGTDQVYPAASTTQVYIPLSSPAWNAIVAGLLIGHNQDGTHKAFTEPNIVPTAAIQDNAVTTAKINDGAATTNKITATTFSGNMTGGSITTAGYTAATVAIPTTTAAHKYLIVASFDINHLNAASIRDYTPSIRLNGVTQNTGKWTTLNGEYHNTIPVNATISTTGGVNVTFVVSRNTDNGGNLDAASHYSIVDVGLA